MSDGSEKRATPPSITSRATCWSVTINNPTKDEVATWANLRQNFLWIKEVKGQLEKGENGTEHIQGLLRTEQVRFSQVKKVFPRAHIEIARNQFALSAYVNKDDTRVAEIKSDLKVANPHIIQANLYESISEVVFRFVPEVFYDKGMSSKHYWRMVQRTTEIERSPVNFIKLLKEENNWKRYLTEKADTLLTVVYDDLIQRGFYGVEFISANNLVHGGFKKHLYSILIRHANNMGTSAEID